MKLEGGCYCGSLRYISEGDPVMKGQCHCRECQYLSGGAPNLFLLMPTSGFSYTKGTPKEFKRKDLERAVTREFCAELDDGGFMRGLFGRRFAVLLLVLSTVMPAGPLAWVGTLYSVTTLVVVLMLAILLAPFSVNHMLPSRPATSASGTLLAAGMR